LLTGAVLAKDLRGLGEELVDLLVEGLRRLHKTEGGIVPPVELAHNGVNCQQIVLGEVESVNQASHKLLSHAVISKVIQHTQVLQKNPRVVGMLLLLTSKWKENNKKKCCQI